MSEPVEFSKGQGKDTAESWKGKEKEIGETWRENEKEQTTAIARETGVNMDEYRAGAETGDIIKVSIRYKRYTNVKIGTRDTGRI